MDIFSVILIALLSGVVGAGLTITIGNRLRKNARSGPETLLKAIQERGEEIGEEMAKMAQASLDKLLKALDVFYKEGDWIIHVGPSANSKSCAYTQRPGYVVELTKTHVTVFRPIYGKEILCLQDYSMFVRSTQAQVDTAWEEAKDKNLTKPGFNWDEEIAKYPFKGKSSKGVTPEEIATALGAEQISREKANEITNGASALVKLKNGTEEVAGVVSILMESIKELGMENPNAFEELVLLCKDKTHEIAGGWYGPFCKAMRDLGLIDGTVGTPCLPRVTGTVRNVVLSAITNIITDGKIGSPFAESEFKSAIRSLSAEQEKSKEDPDIIEIGRKVKVTKLGSTEGMLVERPLLIQYRMEGAVGVIYSSAPSRGNDCWLVRVSGSNEKLVLACYRSTELVLVKEEAPTT